MKWSSNYHAHAHEPQKRQWLAGFMEIWPHAYFWGMNAALVAGAAVLLLVVRAAFGRILDPDALPEDAALDAAVLPAH